MVLVACIGAMVAWGVGTPAVAQVNIPIVNFSFEDPVVANNVFTVSGIPGWTNTGVSGVWRPVTPASFFDLPLPDGNQIGYTNSTAVAQALGATLEQGSYALTAAIGNRRDGFEGDVSLQLWAGGTVATGNVTGGTLLTSAILTVNQQVNGSFVDLTANYAANAGDPSLGQTLTIRIEKLNGTQIDFDNIRLVLRGRGNAAAPEPTSLALWGVGLLGVAVLRRRR
jgi:hypothetical protein